MLPLPRCRLRRQTKVIMRQLRYVHTLVVVLLSCAGVAQIRGRIIEISAKGDSSAVPGAVVLWQNTNVASTSDASGQFRLAPSPLSNRLVLSAVGYRNDTLTVTDSTKFLLLVLRSGVNLGEVEVVYLSSGTEINYLGARKVETLNERSLMKAACCNLSESFETNPSIDVNFSDAVSGTKQIQMLGLSGQYAQITKENMPYLRGLGGNYGLTFIPGTWIESIQLSKGAGSVVNGYESFTGQINTELQNPERSDRLHVNSYVNENGRNEYNLNLARRFSPRLAVGLLSHMSFNPLAQDLNGDKFADIPTGKQYNFMNKYAYNTGKGFEAQVGGGYLKDVRNGGQFRSLVKNDTVPLYQIGIDNEKWELYSKTGYVFRRKPGTSMGLQLSYLDHTQQSSYGYNNYNGRQRTFYANYIFQGLMGTTNHTYKVGASFMGDDVREQYGLLRFRRYEQVGGLFAEYAYSRGEKFNLVAGLRGDLHNYYGAFATPRLHLRYAFTPNTILRFSGGHALRTPFIFTDNAYLMASARTWMIHSSDLTLPYGLQPEKGWNYGLNFTQRFKINYREAYVTLDVYRTDFSNQVVVDVDADPQAVHIYNLDGPSFSNTMQFEFNMEPRKRLFVKTAYRFVDTRTTYNAGLRQRPLVSKHRAFVNLSYETRGGHWQFDATTQFNGPKRLPDTQANPAEYQRASESPAYINQLAQITYLSQMGAAKFNIYLGVENLFNYKQTNPVLSSDMPYSRYFDASMVWGPVYGRMLYAGLRLKFK